MTNALLIAEVVNNPGISMRELSSIVGCSMDELENQLEQINTQRRLLYYTYDEIYPSKLVKGQ